MKIYVLAESQRHATSWVALEGEKFGGRAHVIFVDERALEGRQFGRTDVLVLLEGFGRRGDIEKIEHCLALARFSWVPETHHVTANGMGWNPWRIVPGFEPAPRLDDRSALEAWLAS